jgi:hypothetical protein
LQQVLFFRRGQFGAEDQIEKLDRIIQRQEPPVMQVGWRVLDAAQRKRLDRPEMRKRGDYFPDIEKCRGELLKT